MKNWLITLSIVSLVAIVLVSGLIAQEEVVSGLIAQEGEVSQSQTGQQESDSALINVNTVCGNGICEKGEADDCPSCNPKDEALGRCSKRPCIQGTCPSDCSSQGIGQTIRNRVKAGVYTNEDGKEIRVSELAQNRIRLRVNDAEVETELEIGEEQVNNKTKLKVKLSNGRNAEVKIMPSTASEKALERLRLKVCSEENNCTIELKEVGKGNQTELAYELKADRQGKFLGLFKIKMRVQAQVNAENGEIIKTKKPWWAFLVKETDKTSEVE